MFKIITLILLLAEFYGCNKTHQKTHTKNKAQDQLKKEIGKLTLDFGEPVQVDSSVYVMFPLEIKHEDNSLKSSGGGSYEWNIIFLNTQTQQYHLLDSTRKMLIKGYDIDQSSIENNNHKTDEKYLYYSVTINDANKNGRLDDDDPAYLFISDKAGNNFRQISPDNYYVRSWKVIKETNKVLIYAVSPENEKKDNDDKESTPFIYDLNTGALSRQIFDEKFIQDTKKLFDKDWSDD